VKLIKNNASVTDAKTWRLGRETKSSHTTRRTARVMYHQVVFDVSGFNTDRASFLFYFRSE
jgi:hypothetical protein